MQLCIRSLLGTASLFREYPANISGLPLVHTISVSGKNLPNNASLPSAKLTLICTSKFSMQQPSAPTLSSVSGVSPLNMRSLNVPFRRNVRWKRIKRRRGRDTRVKNLKGGIITKQRDVTTFKRETVNFQDVKERMCVEAVGVQNHSTNAPHVLRVASPLNIEYLQNCLQDHPDPDFRDKLLSYARHGVPLGYDGPRATRVSHNWPSAYEYAQAVQNIIDKDVSKGRLLGPFTEPPFINFTSSPVGAFEKRSSGKIRVIHDLSWPPGASVNDGITCDCSVQYITIDQIVEAVRVNGQGTEMAKIDLEDAFKHVLVRPQDWELLGITWPDRNGKNQFYVQTVLPFGCRSSPMLFTLFAQGLKYAMQKEGATLIEHYLDDYFTCAPAGSNTCAENLEIMKHTCRTMGFSVQPKKVVGPTSVLEYIGITIDSNLMQMRISDERLNDILDELSAWQNKRICTKREILSIVGKLTFISKVVRPGRTFVRRMIETSKKVRHLHHRIRLNREFRSDVTWWLAYLKSWNGVSWFYDKDWSSNAELHLWTDASDLGYGCLYERSWIMQPFCAHYTSRSIAWRELYAIVKATATWGSRLARKRVLFHCDNLAVVHILQSGTSKSPEIMQLVRAMFYICANNNIEYWAHHVPGVKNNAADSLSRLQMDIFRNLVPQADFHPTIPKPLVQFA